MPRLQEPNSKKISIDRPNTKLHEVRAHEKENFKKMANDVKATNNVKAIDLGDELSKEMTFDTLDLGTKYSVKFGDFEFDGLYFGTVKYDTMVDNVKANGGNTVHRLQEPSSEKLNIATPSIKSNKVQPSIKQDEVCARDDVCACTRVNVREYTRVNAREHPSHWDPGGVQ